MAISLHAIKPENTSITGTDTDTCTLEVVDLVKKFPVRLSTFKRGTLVAVDKVSFRIQEGETLGLVGESGCGKSTVGRCILHLLPPDSGAIKYRGTEISALSEKQFRPFRRHIQMVFQNPRTSFNGVKPIRVSMFEALSLLNIDRESKKRQCQRLLEEVGLRPELSSRFPFQLSGGQLQRVAIARALAPNPDFIFLDEPTAALDMSIRGQIVNLLLDIQERRRTSYLLVSHDLRVIYSMSHKVMVMYLGQIVEEASREELFAHCLHPYTRSLFHATLIGRAESALSAKYNLVSGEVMQVTEGFRGCKLFQRCRISQPDCSKDVPPLIELRPGHYVRCWRARELPEEGRPGNLTFET